MVTWFFGKCRLQTDAMSLRRLIFSVFLLAVGPLCTAQGDLSIARSDSLLRSAQWYLSRGSTDTARTLFDAALKATPEDSRARLGLVQVAVAEEEWGDALDECEDILKENSRDVAARYYAGISERELGSQRAGPMRAMAWRRARKHFEAAIAIDSLFKDVLYQLGRLMEYKEEWPEAIALARHQLLVRPDQVGAQIGLFHMYRHYIAVTSPDDALPWLLHQGDDCARYFAAEVLRRTKQFPEAEAILVDLLRRPSEVPVQASSMSLARLYASKNNPSRAQAYYWKAIDSITSWLGAALVFEDIKYIISNHELEQYRSISSDRNKSAFFQRFWRRRDPMPAAAINYRLIEHLHRYVIAEGEFEYYGFRTGFSNPDRTRLLNLPKAFFLNNEFNDKGLIYLRQGSPDKIERTMGNLSSFGPTTVDPHEAWIYYPSGDNPQRIFHFARHNTASNNWRLTPLPGDPDLLDNDMLQNLEMYDTRYFRLQQGDPLEVMRLIVEIQQDEKQTVATALTTDRHVWNKGTTEFYVPHAIDAFRSSHGKTLLDVSYAIPFSPLREAASGSTRTIPVETGISTTSPDGRMLSSRLDTLDLMITPDGKGSFIGLFRQVVAPDSVHLTLHVRALNVSALGTWTEHVRIPSFAGTDFMLSDVQLLLPATTGPSIEIDGVKVVQSPFQTYPRAKPLYAYLQVYNLTRDLYGSAEFSVQYVLAPQDDPSDTTVLAEVNRQLTDDSRAEFRMLEIGSIDAGKYLLTVSVTDKKRVQTLRRTREIEITP
jgi:GWxTD domain-containing protein